jgi:antirestriction protein ArdC
MQNYAENDWEKFRVYWAILRPCGIILSAALWTLCRYRHKVHGTGHESRLHRSFGAGFGDELYSKEELIAEMGAAFLCSIAGIANEHTDRNTTAYLQNWISQLQQDNRLIVQAAANAQKAVDLILGTVFESEAEQERDEEAATSGLPDPQPQALAA